VAWMTAEQNAPRQHEIFIKKPLALIHTGPGQELRAAATNGKPTMTPESESQAGIDVLNGGNQSRIGGTGLGIVATVRPGGTATTDGAENAAPGEASPAAAPDPNAPPATGDSASPATAGARTSDPEPKSEAAPAPAAETTDAAKAESSTAQDGTQNGANGGSKKESTSKKKKGLKKIIPW
jgi:hypothetical protein